MPSGRMCTVNGRQREAGSAARPFDLVPSGAYNASHHGLGSSRRWPLRAWLPQLHNHRRLIETEKSNAPIWIPGEGVLRGTVEGFAEEILSALWFNSHYFAAMVGNQLGQELLIHGPTAFYEVLVCRLCSHADFLYLTDVVEQ